MLVVDDSVTIRAMIEQLFDGRNDVTVIGHARNADEALMGIRLLNPDVMTLDIAMPGLDGLTFLERVMRDTPLPVIMVSSAGVKGSSTCDRAMAAGAHACFDKSHLLSDASAFIAIVLAARRGEVAA